LYKYIKYIIARQDYLILFANYKRLWDIVL